MPLLRRRRLLEGPLDPGRPHGDQDPPSATTQVAPFDPRQAAFLRQCGGILITTDTTKPKLGIDGATVKKLIESKIPRQSLQAECNVDGPETATAAGGAGDRVGVGVGVSCAPSCSTALHGMAMEVAAHPGAPGIPPAPCGPTAAVPGSLRTAGLHPSAVGHGSAACLIGGAGDAAPTVQADIPAAGDREL